MNELEFIRQQVSTERAHMGAVRAAMHAVLQAPSSINGGAELFLRAAVRYLVFVLRRFNRQDLEHCAILEPRVPVDAATDRHTLGDLAETLRASSAAIDRLAAALDAPADALSAACRDYDRFYREVLVLRRHSIYHLFEQHYGLAEWRRASFVDADSILEERALYAAVEQSLPAGIELRAPPRPDSARAGP